MDIRAYKLLEESPEEYRIRLYRNQALYGLSNCEVGELCNEAFGVNYDESAHRKWVRPYLQGFDDGYSKSKEESGLGAGLLTEIELARIDLEKEKVQLADQRREYSKLIREQARKESFLESVKKILLEVEPAEAWPLEISVGNSDNDLIVHCTDIHGGLKIDNFCNFYDTEEIKARLQRHLEKIVEIQKRHGSENAYIIFSEVISGLIHSTLKIEANETIINQFKIVSLIISDFLQNLTPYFKEIHVYTAPGNHSRVVERKEDNMKGDNFDHLLPFYLDARLQNYPNIHVYENKIEESIAFFDVRGKLAAAAHGDKDTPATVVQNFTMMFKKQPDLVYLGHRHTNGLSTVYDTKVIQSGCVSGSDNFCMDHRLRNRPEQTISVVDKEGLVCLYDIQLD